MAHQSSLAAVLEHDLMEVGICDLATFLLMLEHDAAEVFNVIMRNDECRAAALRACQPEQATAACQWESPWEKIKEEEEVSTQHGTQTTEEIINLCTAAVTVENITQTTEELVEVVVAEAVVAEAVQIGDELAAKEAAACRAQLDFEAQRAAARLRRSEVTRLAVEAELAHERAARRVAEAAGSGWRGGWCRVCCCYYQCLLRFNQSVPQTRRVAAELRRGR